MDIEYWDKEVASFKRRLPTATPDQVRLMLRGLAVLLTEITREHPEAAETELHEFHDCLQAVHDEGIAFHLESWLRNHCSPEIAASVEKEFAHVLISPA